MDLSVSEFFSPNSRKFWVCALLFKLFLAFNTRPVYQPDENYQSVEVAYQLIYGEVDLSWEWDPKYALRSLSLPSLYYIMFYALKLLHLDWDLMIRYFPNVFHALLSLVADWYFVKIIHKLTAEHHKDTEDKNAIISYANKVAVVGLLIYYTSWYSSILMVKTFSNTIEAVFNAIILYKWLKIKGDGKLIDVDAIILTVLITISFIMRNTSIVPWLIPMAYKVFVHKTLMKFLFWGFAVAIPIIVISVAWDSYYYGGLTFTALNFLNFNVLSGQSKHFGINSPFNYVLIYPLIQMMTLYPFLILGLVQDLIYHLKNKAFPLLSMIFWPYVFVLSLIGHKENRFMLPLFQICWILTAFSIVSLTQHKSSAQSHHLIKVKNYSLIGKIVKLAIVSRVIISVVVWLHLTQYNSLMHLANDYVKALNPQNYVFISADTDGRSIIDYNFKSESNTKLLMFNINPQFTLRDSQSMLKLSFISKQNKAYT